MSNKAELSLEPIEGELLPDGKIPTVTPEQVNALTVIKSVSKIEVLANTEETAKGVELLKASYLPIVEQAKADMRNVKIKADLDKAKRTRLDIADERVKFTKSIDAELLERRELIKNAVAGRKAVEDALSDIESDLLAIEKPIEDGFKTETARKKTLADAIAKLRTHTINPLLPAADIEAVIDDFRLAFGDSSYQESQQTAELIFEAKIAEFEVILAAAKQREENEAAVRLEQARNQQRLSIKAVFPIDIISNYADQTSDAIQRAKDFFDKSDMTAFSLVQQEAETTKQSCLNMLAAFLPMAVAREAKEAADKAEAERIECEKQAEIDSKAAREANVIDSVIAEAAMSSENFSELIESVKEAGQIQRGEIEAAAIAVINNNAGFADDAAKIIGEPAFECVESHEALEVAEVTSELVQDDCVLIPVKHLKELISAIESNLETQFYTEDELAALAFAKSLI